MLKYRLSPDAYGGNHSDYFVSNIGSGVHISQKPYSSGKNVIENVINFDLQYQIEEFCRLYGMNMPIWPPKSYKKVVSQIAPDTNRDDIQWWKVMGFKKYISELQSLANNIQYSVSEFDISYWHDIYNRLMNNLFEELDNCRIDVELYKKYKSEATASQMEIIETFKPDTHGYADRVIYSGTETKTGRLKVIDGPNILHLKKDYRNMIISSHGDKGKIVYLDYSSLEPRILLCVSNPSLIGSLPQDIYSKMLADLNLSEKIPRTVAKTAILSALYGQKEENTIKTLSNYIGSAEDFLNVVNDYFGIDKLKEKLAGDLLKTGGRYILNYYGRPIFCEDTKPYALLNYYVQSTAVDVAMLGFLNIVSRLKDNHLTDKIKPIFILHDALFLDIHEDAYHIIPKIEKLGSTGIKGFKNIDFWLRSE
jgi:hypothetical protein